MTRLALAGVVGTLGLLAALDPPFSRADDPAPPATVTVVTTVDRTVDGWPAAWWAARSRAWHRRFVQADRNSRARGRTVRRLRHVLAHTPTVTEAVKLARVVYGVDQTSRVHCESKGSVTAINHQGADSPSSILQFKPSTWRSTPFAGFSIWSPYAQALAGGWMVDHGRSSEWACGL